MIFSTDFVAATEEYADLDRRVPAPRFRKVIDLPSMEQADFTICGLGYYDLFINGKKITKGLLSPYTANPDDVLYYDTYDLLPYLQTGKNCIAILLGNGFLNNFGGASWDFDKAAFRSAPKMALTFEGKTKDGETISFDARDGFLTSSSAILLDDLRLGEWYDARLEEAGWMLPDFDASSWKQTIPAETPKGECRLCDIDPIVVTEKRRAIGIRQGKIGHFSNESPKIKQVAFPADEAVTEGYLYDFGINAAGLPYLTVRNARPGQKIILQFGELLDENGELDLRGSVAYSPRRFAQRVIYVCKGGACETYRPSFTYFAFRYALVIGLDEKQATPELITYEIMNSDLKPNAGFSCSDETANALWNATIVSDLANFYHFPTDCPHREKNGWTGDAALSAEQMLVTLTPEKNFREWLVNIRKAMNEAGALPGIVPTAGWGFAWGNGPAWDCVLTYLPYYVWLYRGDTQILEENADAIFRYLNYLTTRRDAKGLMHIGLGDWCQSARIHWVGPKAPLAFTDTVVCMDICRKAARIFGVLGRTEEKAFAEKLGDEFYTAGRKYLIDKNTMTALGRCQTTQAMAIFHGLFTDAEKPLAFERLLELIEAKKGTFDCGTLGLRVIFHVLSDFGRADLAYHMIVNEDFPSYAYWIRMGETSLCESFRRPGDPKDSHNHHFMGDIVSWFMRTLVGIRPNPHEENPNEIRFSPCPIDALDHAEGWEKIPAGRVEAAWKREGKTVVYTVTVPEGAVADCYLPCGYQTVDGFTYLELKPGTTTVRIISEDEHDLHDGRCDS